ncbi:MAG: LacI family DNA-binding transcriptional regulator [Reichenbachiella sp.]|uniref:LacI family DNA-binding transcriptional regulator n=1 Tax=Reichenbachiella sp. TaxID=2184521 RepID=UPI0032634F6E
MKGQVTLKDIAKMLKISVPTVSRALKNYPDISRETKRKVLQLVEELNYRPNQFALNLRKNKSNTIGVLIPEIVHHFFSTVISGIIEVADEQGYSVMLFQTNESFEREVRETRVMLNGRVDGLLISLSNETKNLDHLREFERHNVPVVLFDKVMDGLQASQVVVDDFEGAYSATQHLIDQGNERIAYIRGPLEPRNSVRRYNGFVKALEDAGRRLDERYLKTCHRVSKEEGYEFTQELLNLTEPPDAIFAATDLVAIGSMQAIHDKGLEIPKDISLCGFSDWMMASAVNPPLTSVRQPGFEMGRQAAELLFSDIKNIDEGVLKETKTVELKTELIQRASTTRI